MHVEQHLQCRSDRFLIVDDEDLHDRPRESIIVRTSRSIRSSDGVSEPYLGDPAVDARVHRFQA
ncbi:MAG TPA: hypothetical protein VFZ53_21170, partial [Polyangiaceae bacterium]